MPSKILFICLIFFLFISCKNKEKYDVSDEETEVSTEGIQNNNSDGIIIFDFKEQVGKYKVKVYWFPSEVINGTGEVSGSAIIKLLNAGTKEISTITTNYFVPYRNSIEGNDISIKIPKLAALLSIDAKERELKLVKSGTIIVEKKDDIWTNLSFEDVNFDGKDELLLTEFGAGQRGFSNEKIFDLSYGMEEMNYEPFNQIDEETIFDKDKKEIIIIAHGGACSSSNYTYKKTGAGWFELVETEEMQSDEKSGDCYGYTYKIDKKLVEKKKYKQ
jgi:hypothetical protein